MLEHKHAMFGVTSSSIPGHIISSFDAPIAVSLNISSVTPSPVISQPTPLEGK